MMWNLEVLVIVFLAYLHHSEEDEPKCRIRLGNGTEMLIKDDFDLHSCTHCYSLLMSMSGKEGYDVSLLPEGMNRKSLMEFEPIRTTFHYNEEIKWVTCCDAATACCDKMRQDPTRNESGVFCPRTWDGWHCWEDTGPSTTLYGSCPVYSSPTKPCPHSHSVKQCDVMGKWNTHPSDNTIEWTDYTACTTKSVVEKRVYVSIAAYIPSLILLIPALFIFQKYRALHCHRIAIHKNLFASLLCNCTTEIIFQSTIIMTELDEGSIIQKNGNGCKMLLIVTKYFRLTNYMWMFCEGFYLHRQIFNIFAEEANFLIFHAIGWGFPILPVVLFAILRSTLADVECWATPSGYDWAINTPSLLSLLINFMFLFNIVRVLVIQLRAFNPDDQIRRAFRGTLVLVPLFGLHFFFTLYRFPINCDAFAEYYNYADHLLDGLQGAFVALIFCYINTEVTTQLKRTWRNMLERHHLGHRLSVYNGNTTSVIISQTAV